MGNGRRPNGIMVLGAMAVVVLLAACEPQAPVAIAVGAPLPAQEVRALDGGRARLQPVPGKVMVLNVWAVWCHPCREEMPSLERLSSQLDPERFTVIGLSVDQDRYLVEEFLRRYGIRFPVYLDTAQRSVQRQLGVTVLPETFLVAADGRVQARIAGQYDWERPRVRQLLERLQREGSLSREEIRLVLGR